VSPIDLTGQTALLTGATGGLGTAIGYALATAGVNLALSDRVSDPLERRVKELADLGVSVVPLVADLTDRDAPAMLVEHAERQLGRLDILINNAGVEFAGPAAGRTPQNLGLEVDLNLVAPMLLTHAALPGMVRRGHGHVVGISSIAGLIALPYFAGYVATKTGLAAYMRAMHAEHSHTGVRFSTVFPGLIRNGGMGAELVDVLPRRWQRLLTRTPEEVGAAVVRVLRENRRELVVSATPARPSAFLAALAPGVSVRVLGVGQRPILRGLQRVGRA
jgi:short-subunit dehydrogenase